MTEALRSVWIVNHYAGDPAETASGSRHFSLARELAACGWTPTIVAASVEHNTSRQRLTDGERIGTTRRDGVTFRWLRTSTYGGNGIGRIVNILQFTAALLGRRWSRDLPGPDVVVGSTVHPLAALAASRIARRHRVPFVFEIRDLWPQTLIDMGKISPRGPVARVLRQIERRLCDRATTVVTLLPDAGRYLTGRGVPAEKIVWISNGTDTADFAAAPRVRPPGDGFVFLYLGSLGNANGVHTIIRAFAQVEDPTAVLRIVGSGPQREALRALASELGVRDRVRFDEPVPKQQVPEVTAAADALLVNLLDLPIYAYGISLNKLFDYLASARPIIIASNASNNPVRDADAGVTVPADSADGLAEAMNRVVAAGDDERARWGRNAVAHVREHYDYTVLGGRFDALLRAATRAAAREREGVAE